MTLIRITTRSRFIGHVCAAEQRIRVCLVLGLATLFKQKQNRIISAGVPTYKKLPTEVICLCTFAPTIPVLILGAQLNVSVLLTTGNLLH